MQTQTTATRQQLPDAAGEPPAIELIGINKSFGNVRANRDIDLSIKKGSIHGIVGENGAGKSTLMSILYGFYQADSGEIKVNGKKVHIAGPRAAIAAGIGMVHQHFMLVENISVLENVVLGAEDGPWLKGSLDRARTHLEKLAREYELEVDPDALICDLSVGFQQRVEILKALYRGADILILDEPTGVLTPSQADHLFQIFEQLKQQGKTIILITHKLREIMAVTDTVSVMRQGAMTAEVKTSETSPAQLAELMVGRPILMRVEKTKSQPGEPILQVDDLRVFNQQGVERIKGISLSVHAGEIVGVAGVAGNGQSELLETIAGIRHAKSGTVRIGGVAAGVTGNSNAKTLRHLGVSHVPEDRHKMGMIGPFEEWENSVLGLHDEPENSGGFIMKIQTILQHADDQMQRYDIRPPNVHLRAENFSGGNQQKIVLAREIDREPQLLLIGQPTRGVDIGAIEFIHKQIIELRDRGNAILLVSVELEEIMSLSDRIIVMFDGHISGERDPEFTNEKELGLLMAGINEAAQ